MMNAIAEKDQKVALKKKKKKTNPSMLGLRQIIGKESIGASGDFYTVAKPYPLHQLIC